MKVTNVFSDKHRTPARKAEEKEVRELFQTWKPGPEELLASGKWDGPVLVEGAEQFWKAIEQVRASREAQGLTLKAVSARCGIDVATLSKLENRKQANPTLFTMLLYVGAVDMRLEFAVGPRTRPDLQVSEIRDSSADSDGSTQGTGKRAKGRRKAKLPAQTKH